MRKRRPPPPALPRGILAFAAVGGAVRPGQDSLREKPRVFRSTARHIRGDGVPGGKRSSAGIPVHGHDASSTPSSPWRTCGTAQPDILRKRFAGPSVPGPRAVTSCSRASSPAGEQAVAVPRSDRETNVLISKDGGQSFGFVRVVRRRDHRAAPASSRVPPRHRRHHPAPTPPAPPSPYLGADTRPPPRMPRVRTYRDHNIDFT
jgi:hypothetical protein